MSDTQTGNLLDIIKQNRSVGIGKYSITDDTFF